MIQLRYLLVFALLSLSYGQTSNGVERAKIDSLKLALNGVDTSGYGSGRKFQKTDYSAQEDSTILFSNGQAVDTVKKESKKESFDDGILYNQYLDIDEKSKFYQRSVLNDVPLKRFGEEFIRSLKSSYPKFGPINPSYRIGYGDEISISIWGEVQSKEKFTVDREGRISPQGIGVVSVAGRSIDDIKKTLIARYSQIYSGVRNGQSNASTFVEVTLGELKSKQVFVVGNVANPGTYTIPSTAGVLGALAFAGGPSSTGSLRAIVIKRGSRTIDTVDCYDYLLSGRIDEKTSLADMDVIVVPTIQKKVAIGGAVYTPAIFELKQNEDFSDLLKYAGGYLPEAYTRSFNVTRTLNHDQRNTMTIFDSDSLRMMANDSLVIPFVDNVVNTVSIEGAVKRSGNYGVYPGMTLKNLIEMADGVSDDYFVDRAEVIRTYENFDKEIIAVKIGELLNGNKDEDVVLKKWDIVKIFSKWDIKYRHYVSIHGEVRKPGKYFLRDSMTVQDLILLAGGFTNKAYKDTVELSRVIAKDRSAGNVTRSISIGGGESFYQKSSDFLEHMDNIFIRENSTIKEQEVVYLKGEFSYPGFYAKRSDDETLLSLIKRAGGIKQSAYLEGARFIRGKDSLGIVAINVKRLIEKERIQDDIILESGDTLFIPTVPKTVVVDGAVNYPTSVKFEPGKKIRYYTQRAGGFSSDANVKSIYVILANGEVRQVKKRSSVVNAGSAVVVPKIDVQKERFNWAGMASTMLGLAASSLSILIAVNTLKDK